MNTNEIRTIGTDLYRYRGYAITGNEQVRYVCIAPYGAFSPESYSSIEEARAAIDEDIAESR